MKLTLGVKYFLALEAFEPQNGILTSLKNIHTYVKFYDFNINVMLRNKLTLNHFA